MRFATYTAGGQTQLGTVTDAGMTVLNSDVREWPSLFDAVVEGIGLVSNGVADE